jgi:hypothetical protein
LKFDKNKELKMFVKYANFDREFGEPALIKDLIDRGYDVKIFTEAPYVRWRMDNLFKKLRTRPKISLFSFSENFLDTLLKSGNVLVVMLDKWYLDMSVHTPHYVFIKDADKDSYYINDPWLGEEMRISKSRLTEAVFEMKTRLNFSPVVYAVKG